MNLSLIKKHSVIFLVAAVASLLCYCRPKQPEQPALLFNTIEVKYPATKRDSTVSDKYFGTKVLDSYRWLETDTSVAVVAWAAQQNILTESYFSKIPYRGKIAKRMAELWNFENLAAPYQINGKYYFFKNDGLQDQNVLYVMDRPNGQPKEVLDPNLFSNDGSFSIEEYKFSKDGRYFAYSLSTNGSDKRRIKVRDLQTNTDLPDIIDDAIYTDIGWDGAGFYYSRFRPILKNTLGIEEASHVYYHQMGTSQDQDRLVYSDPVNAQRFHFAITSKDEQFTTLFGMDGIGGNTLQIKRKGEAAFLPITTSIETSTNMMFNQGDSLYLLSNKNAPNNCLYRVDAAQPSEANWVKILPENNTDVLSDAYLAGDKILALYLHNAHSALRVFNLSGTLLQEIALPEIGSVVQINPTEDGLMAYFSFKSFLRPTSVYALDMATFKIKQFDEPVISFNADDYLTEQAWATSKDGTKIPLFISYKKGTKMDGTAPTLLYGYGGFNYSIPPTFAPSKAALLEKGGIFVVANIRGGGEFGQKWYKSGNLLNKHKCFEDFIATAEYLIEKKYTTQSRLAIEGASNGGLLVAAVMNMRPDLFSTVFVQEGVLDMLRYHNFGIGYAWADEYGRSDESQAAFQNLYAYSPLHNIKKISYPATLISTADHDDRVVPGHSFKYAANLQYLQQGKQPILLQIQKNTGHGSDKPRATRIAESTDQLAFMLYQMKFNYE